MTTATSWQEANQAALAAEIARVRAALERHAGVEPADRPTAPPPAGATPDALGLVTAAFGLTAFERDVLVLAAAAELDGSIPALCGLASGDPARAHPTFGLALAALDDPHWSALAADGPLRRWSLVEATGPSLTRAAVRIDERVLHFLTGLDVADVRVAAVVDEIGPAPALPASHEQVAADLLRAWTTSSGGGPLLAQLVGDDHAAKLGVIAFAAAAAGHSPRLIAAAALPTAPAEIDHLLRLFERDAALGAGPFVLDASDVEGDHARLTACRRLLERSDVVVGVTTRDPMPGLRRPAVTIAVRLPSREEQAELWRAQYAAVTGGGGLPAADVDRVVDHFHIGAETVAAAVRQAVFAAEPPGDGPASVAAALWDACRAATRPALGGLAQRVEPQASFADLILPAAEKTVLREIVAHVRNRAVVHERWGFLPPGSRGVGVTALFAGPSGTGKTLAAEVIAHALELDLFKIDLSKVVDKYIGETEKNLGRVFDAAEHGGAVLLFDEADALFGKRSEVKDSHDRYANIEVSYLLQRMEAYRGLAILTTNLRSAIDAAFLRRLRFVVTFPHPDASQRAELWRRAFPPSVPVAALDLDRLSRLNLTGANVRNIALHAAFLAADAGDAVSMDHLAAAATRELVKLERSASEVDAAWR